MAFMDAWNVAMDGAFARLDALTDAELDAALPPVALVRGGCLVDVLGVDRYELVDMDNLDGGDLPLDEARRMLALLELYGAGSDDWADELRAYIAEVSS